VCIHHRFIALFLNSRRHNSKVEIVGHCIIKTYTGANRFQRVAHLQTIYKLLDGKKVPNVDSLKHLYSGRSVDPLRPGDQKVVLSPRGIATTPASEEELVEALICVLNALVVSR